MLVAELLRAGAHGYVLKSDVMPQLIDAIEALAAHKTFFTGKVSDALLKSYLSREKATLNDREQSIARLLPKGTRTRRSQSSLA
jgi:DNA-binding NarL/FixJ family response regulator